MCPLSRNVESLCVKQLLNTSKKGGGRIRACAVTRLGYRHRCKGGSMCPPFDITTSRNKSLKTLECLTQWTNLS